MCEQLFEDQMTQITSSFEKKSNEILTRNAHRLLASLIQPHQYVGELYSISYETALVQIHDYYRQKVGGIPSLSFLIASRIDPSNENIDFQAEDSSIILLRVMDAAQLPNDSEAERIRVQSAQQVSGELSTNWDDQAAMDSQTHNLLSFGGVKCRVIGTFFLSQQQPSGDDNLVLRFGSDLSNYYPNRGLKVYKPNKEALETIVNYIDPDALASAKNHVRVPIGEVRYASTNRQFQGVSNVVVSITPADLLRQKTALFGMTRTGKSNTTKIIARAIFDLRFDRSTPLRIGQIIFDPNGEYANENVQDTSKRTNPNALKNVWKSNTNGKKEDVVTYGVLKHPNDPERKLMLINFYEDKMLQVGKEIINDYLAEDSSKYIQNFILVNFEEPTGTDQGLSTRYKRRVLVYRALLKKAGFEIPVSVKTSTKFLFNADLLSSMKAYKDSKDGKKQSLINNAATILEVEHPSWDSLASAFEGLHLFFDTEEYQKFNTDYINEKADRENWADPDLRRILEMFVFTKGASLIGKARVQHTNNSQTDFAIDIYNDLKNGKLVIIDQSSGDPEINNASAKRIMWQIFRSNQKDFREGNTPPDILIYVEEAHNLLPSGSDLDLTDVWVRTAKEGAKYEIGLVYITQEVSSIQRNILKNTANWFIGHLNNKDETKELNKFYDFADFESSIIRSQDRGFLRVKTLSNLFVVPVQVKKFELEV